MTNPKREEISMDDRMPAEVELRGIGLSFTLGAGKNLSRTWQRELRTESESRFRASVTRDSLEMTFSPPILIDAQWPAMNMQLGGVKRVFSTGQTTVFLGSIHGVAEGLVDFSEDAKKEINALITSGVSGTAMAQLGYNPMQDAQIISTLEAVTEHFRRQPKQGTSDVEYSDFGRVQIHAHLALKTDFRHVEKSAGLLVRRGTTIDVVISGRGNMATLLRTRTNAERAAAAEIESVTISSDGLLVILNEKPIAYLDRIRIDRGGTVTLEKVRLEGIAGEAEGMESLLRTVASAIEWTTSGTSVDAGTTVAANSRDALAIVVPEIVRGEIEKTLTEGTKQLLRGHRAVIPEVDLEEVFLA
jgi:hypothetical protein